MFILKGTKATVLGREVKHELEVPHNCYANKGDYIALNDGWEYIFEEFDGQTVYVRS